MLEGINLKKEEGVNTFAIDEIQDFKDNATLRTLLETNGIIEPGSVVTEEDFSSMRTRAKKLLEENTAPMSVETALITACFDRLMLKEKIGMESLKSLPTESLRALFYGETKVMFTDEEIELFKNSPLPLKDWALQRNEVRATLQ